MTSRPSAEQRLMMLADAARRAESRIAKLTAVNLSADPEQRPRAEPGGRVSVPRAAWDALADARDTLAALIALATASDVEGR